jgi:uncharacterized membrane protein
MPTRITQGEKLISSPMLPRLLIGFAIVAVTLTASSSSSFAQFQVCNQTSAEQINVAIGAYRQSTGWQSKGWYAIARNQCTSLIDSMTDRYYYLYVEAGDTVWDGMSGQGSEGSSNFCIDPQDAFDIDVKSLSDGGSDNPNCEKHNYQTKRFIRVDTEGYGEYTFNIND